MEHTFVLSHLAFRLFSTRNRFRLDICNRRFISDTTICKYFRGVLWIVSVCAFARKKNSAESLQQLVTKNKIPRTMSPEANADRTNVSVKFVRYFLDGDQLRNCDTILRQDIRPSRFAYRDRAKYLFGFRQQKDVLFLPGRSIVRFHRSNVNGREKSQFV